MASNTNEEAPQVLEEGTEVSAKFKGAFCEARIKKVDRIVKCKIIDKYTNESLTVVDSQIYTQTRQRIPINDLKQGQSIYYSKSNDSSSLYQATLNRIIDQSVYTVVFNDGDEKCLKRSFIRFKGEKHYLDSETLNNAPLNNPEHFLYPIKSQNKNSPNSSLIETKRQNESENESETESVSNTTCTSLSIKNKKEKEVEVEVEEDEAEDDEAEEDETSSTSSFDDYPSEEKDLFVAQLYKFMDDRGTPMNKVPSINKIDIDLHKLFVVVKKLGGYNKINKQRIWSDVYKRVGLPCPSSSNIMNLKCSYKRYIHPYEELLRKLGGSILVSSGTSKRSVSSDSKRLFNARYLTPSSQKKVHKANKKTVDNSEQNNQETQEETHNESLNQEKEFTIESLANACNDEMNQQSQEELTLSGMFKNLNENFKKAKKEVKKRFSNSKTKIRRTSADKLSEKSKKSEEDEYEENEDEEEEENEEEEEIEELKKRKKSKRSTDVSEESNSTSATRMSKRKSSTSRPNEDESENEKKSSEAPLKKVASNDSEGKKIYRSSDIELNKIVEVKYGSGKTTYHAKIVQINEDNQTMLVHYLGWNNRYDEWIKINQILKIFSDDYGAYKRRKPIKTDPDASPSQAKSKTEPKNPKLGKRSSLSSTSSSSSGAETSIKKEPQSVEPSQKESKFEKKNALKMRSSDSSSSVSSSSEPSNLCQSIVRIKKSSSNGSNNFEKEQKSMELELEKIKNTQPEALLSIKEEIIDFEQCQNENQEEKLNFIKSINDDLLDKCFNLIVEKEKNQEYKPKTMCKKDELIPVFSSEMVIINSNKFIAKSKNDEDEVDESPKPETEAKIEYKQKSDEIKEDVEELQKTKLVLNESSLNTNNQNCSQLESKNTKEKENSKHAEQTMPKYPFHLIGCKLVGKQKIRFIEEQMRLCREEYAKLKNEMAGIDRKKKKLKRNLFEKSASNTNSATHEDATKVESKK